MKLFIVLYYFLLPGSHYEIFLQLTLHFLWRSRSPWRWTNIFVYSPWWRKKVAFFVNMGTKTRKAKFITTKPLQSGIVFSYLKIFPIRISWELFQFIFSGKFLIYPGNKYNNCFFDLYGEYCPPNLGWYVELKNISWYRSKNSYYCIKIKLIPSKLFFNAQTKARNAFNHWKWVTLPG